MSGIKLIQSLLLNRGMAASYCGTILFSRNKEAVFRIYGKIDGTKYSANL